MDENQLSRLHDDFKKGSETRGKHGGLGKSAKSGGKRIQIEYVEKSSTSVPAAAVSSGPDPKQPFIRFVRASKAYTSRDEPEDEKSDAEDKKKQNGNGINLESSSDEEEESKPKRSSKTNGVKVKESTKESEKKPAKKQKVERVRCAAVVEIAAGKDLLKSLKEHLTTVDDATDVKVENAWAAVSINKVVVAMNDNEEITVKNCQFASLVGSMDVEGKKSDLQIKVFKTGKSTEEFSGRLLKCKSKEPIQVLLTYSVVSE